MGGIQPGVAAIALSKASVSSVIPVSLSSTLPRMSGSASLEKAHTCVSVCVGGTIVTMWRGRTH